jgi:hypothetical protein
MSLFQTAIDWPLIGPLSCFYMHNINYKKGIIFYKKVGTYWASKFVVELVFHFFSRNRKVKIKIKRFLSKLERKKIEHEIER